MVNETQITPFFPIEAFRTKTVIKNKARTIVAGEEYPLLNIRSERGRLHQVSVNLSVATSAILVVKVDDSLLVNHDHDAIQNDGDGHLGLKVTQGYGSVLQTTRSTASNYAMSFYAPSLGISFKRELDIYIKNASSASITLQGAYVLYDIRRWFPNVTRT